MNILVIMHVESEGPGTLGTFFETVNAEIHTVRLYAGHSLPTDPSTFDAVVSMGGPMNVYEEGQYPFLKDETVFLRKALDANLPMMGICLGAQMIAKAADAAVTKSPEEEVGWGNVRLTDAGRRDVLFQGLPESFDVLQWHGDMFHIPEGGKLLASSGPCPNQAFRYRNAFGLQFHLEVTSDIIQEWFADSAQLAEILQGYEERELRLTRHSQTMYKNFLTLIR